MKSLFDIGYITTHIHRVHGVIYHMTWMRVAIYLVVMPFFFFFCDLTKARNDRQTRCIARCWSGIGPPSTMLAQHWTGFGLMCRVCWVFLFITLVRSQRLISDQCLVR